MVYPFDLAWRWVRKGNALRDAGKPIEAAGAYKRALAWRPKMKDVRVQLGNMLKDSGRYSEAEGAYRAALLHGANVFDTYLQLGHALRLAGKREAALEAFAAALKANPSSRDAVREMVALGESWTAQKHVGLGASAIVEVVSALEDVKQTLARIERTLPEVANLAGIPISRWDLWRQIWQVPAAPVTSTPLALLVLCDPAPLPAVLDCLNTVERQRHKALTVSLISSDAHTIAAFEKRASLAPELYFHAPTPSGSTEPDALRAALDAPQLADAEWIAVAIEPVVFHAKSAGWFAAAVTAGSAVGAFSDEDTVIPQGNTPALEAPTHAHPNLKGAADPELLDQGRDLGNLIVALRSELIAALNSRTCEQSDWWLELHQRLVSRGSVEHVQQVLYSRHSSVVAARAACLAGTPPLPASQVPKPPKLANGVESMINVIVPTRDRGELLRTCIESLRATADASHSVTFTVIDNGSRDPATPDYLDHAQKMERLQVLKRDEPFNWSRLNNSAVSECSSPLLVFCNNDIEMVSAGWDTALRRHLARPEIGVVGARLLYPDLTVQHAGIVFGIGVGGTEHEGRGASAGDGGPNGRWHMRRSVAAVTGAFLACRRSDFESLGGFDTDMFGIWCNDVDFCLKIRQRGLRVLYEPAIEAYHHESKSLAVEFDDQSRAAHFLAAVSAMRMKWGRALEDDPYFNAHYARWGTPFSWLGPPPPVSSWFGHS